MRLFEAALARSETVIAEADGDELIRWLRKSPPHRSVDFFDDLIDRLEGRGIGIDDAKSLRDVLENLRQMRSWWEDMPQRLAEIMERPL